MTANRDQMGRSARTLHRAVGIATVLVFFATGLFLRYHRPPMTSYDDATRLLFRSGHIYLLFAGLVNLALGLHLSPLKRPAARHLAFAGSVLLVIAPVFLLAGFCFESAGAGMSRPIIHLGIYAAFGGVMLHFLGGLRSA
jgi:succinate dehydrogenase/fumarate reductase cytochrome b subunit